MLAGRKLVPEDIKLWAHAHVASDLPHAPWAANALPEYHGVTT